MSMARHLLVSTRQLQAPRMLAQGTDRSSSPANVSQMLTVRVDAAQDAKEARQQPVQQFWSPRQMARLAAVSLQHRSEDGKLS